MATAHNGTGRSSASRSASHSRAAAPWHFGQCLLRQVMGVARIPTRWTNLPPLPQENEHLGRQHDVAILALRLLDANDVLRPVDVLDLQPHHLAGAQATAIAE